MGRSSSGRLFARLCLVVVAACSGCGGPASAPEGAPPGRWNVLLVSVDTLRADHLGSYGAKDLETPGFDRIAREGVRFDDVQSVATTTLPAHASLLTGTTPLVNGVHDNVGFYLPSGTETLASYLKARGYDTAAFVGSFVLDRRFGLDQGFDVYDDDMGVASGEDATVSQRRGDVVLARALDWLGHRAKDAPFFAFVHFYDPHTPYLPPEGFATGEDDRGRYRGEVKFVDALVSKLLDWLDQNRLAERTLVVVTADHGESLGEHGELTHGYFLYQSTLRIPLLLRYPGGPRGSRVGRLARLIDVTPTIVDLLGLPSMPGAEGRSLVPAIGGTSLGGSEEAYAETDFPRLHYGFSALFSLRRGSKKFVLAPRPELYDLDVDPGESRNLVEEEPELAEAMRQELIRIRAGASSASASASTSNVDAETRRRLDSLGYAGAGSASASSREPRLDPKDGLEIYLTVNDPSFETVSPREPARFAEALRRLEDAKRKAPRIPRIYLLEGEMLLKADRAPQAEKVFAELVKLEPDGFSGRYGLGVALARQGKQAAAVDALERARALEPRNTKAYLELADVEAARGNRDRAEDWLRRALEIREDAVLANRLAELLVDEGKGGAAIQLLSDLAKANERDPGLAYSLGRLLLGQGQLERALVELRRAASLSPEDPDVQLALGNALAGQNHLDEAIAAYRRALESSPCFAPAHSNLGSTYARLGQVSEAAASFEKAVACDPGYAIAYKNLAAIRLQQGDVGKAVAAMKSAVRASPGDPEMKRLLDELLLYQRSKKN